MAQNTVTAQAGRKPKKQKQSQFSGMSRALVRRETISAYLFLLPSLIFFVTFVVVPMFICLFYSFTKYGLGGIKGFAGLMYQVYDTAYRLNDLGYACAIGVVLAIIIAIFSAIQFKVAKTD